MEDYGPSWEAVQPCYAQYSDAAYPWTGWFWRATLCTAAGDTRGPTKPAEPTDATDVARDVLQDTTEQVQDTIRDAIGVVPPPWLLLAGIGTASALAVDLFLFRGDGTRLLRDLAIGR